MKNEVDVLGSPVPNTNCPHGLCGRKATLKKMGVKHKLSVYSATPFFILFYRYLVAMVLRVKAALCCLVGD